VLVFFATSWAWIVAATALLGVQQGLCWSMTQTAKLDLTLPGERGHVLGLNEFAGYAGVALAGWGSALAADALGARTGLGLGIGSVVLAATAHAWIATRETLPFARHDAAGATPLRTAQAFARLSWRDRRLAAVCQAGLVEKFVDALVWIAWPLQLHRAGVPLPRVGAIVGAYGLTWGVAQLATGRASDRFGRQPLNVGGMVLCGAGVLAFALSASTAAWTLAAAGTGLGMAMLYPNLSAAIADLADPGWRASAIGIYRFWRDLGYAVGAGLVGLVAARAGLAAAGFVVAAAMGASAAWLAAFGVESAPRATGSRPAS
jgi:MFS family permease